MKLTVITGRAGKIIGTAHADAKRVPGAGAGGPIAGSGQKLQVIDLPSGSRMPRSCTGSSRPISRSSG
jgi:hypothetical protein